MHYVLVEIRSVADKMLQRGFITREERDAVYTQTSDYQKEFDNDRAPDPASHPRIDGGNQR